MEVIIPQAGDASSAQKIGVLAVFRQGLGLWQKNLLALCGTYLIGYLPPLLLQVYALVKYGPKPDSPTAAGAAMIINLAIVILSIWAYVALILAVQQGLGQARIRPLGNIKDAGRLFLPVLLAALIYIALALAVIILASACGVLICAPLYKFKAILGIACGVLIAVAVISVFVYYGLRLSLVYLAIVLENLSPVAALRRSWQLVQARINPVVGTLALIAAAALAVYLPVFVILAAMAAWKGSESILVWGYSLAQYGLGSLFAPFGLAVMISLYGQLKEAQDFHVHA